MKSILVYFYPGNNLGDDLFLKILSERYPSEKFEISVYKGYKKLLLKNFRVSPYAKITYFTSILLNKESNSFINTAIKIIANQIKLYSEKRLKNKKYKARILITGSLFQQGEKCNINSMPEIFDRFNSKCPNYLIGANFGPFYESAFLEQYKNGFKSFDSISFRDKHSYNYFKDMTNAIYAPDVVLSGRFHYEVKTPSNNIVFSVMNFSIKKQLKQYYDDYINKCVEIIKLFSIYKKKVTLISFCNSQGDDLAVNTIIKKCNENNIYNVQAFYYTNNLEAALELISQSEFVIATRFHSMILGWYFNKSVFPIVYGEKMQHCIEDFEYSDNYIKLEKIKELNVEEVYENYINNNIIDIREIKKLANNHFKELDKLLTQEK